jgi:hypothetical protein
VGLLKALFGPSREEIWRQLADQIGAEYVDGGFWRGDKVVARVGEWTVTLDTYTVSSGKHSTTYTRMRAPFVNRDGFRFTIRQANIFTGVAEALGFTDISIGDPDFDGDYVIKGNDPEKVGALLASDRLRELIRAQRYIHLTVKDDEGWFGEEFPIGVDELYFSAVGVIKDLDRLHALYELFAETLQQLCVIGSAYEDDPAVTL